MKTERFCLYALVFFLGINSASVLKALQCADISARVLRNHKYYSEIARANQKLLQATQKGDIETIKSLFASEVKPDVMARDEWGQTAVMLAAQALNTKILQFLADNRADLFIKDDHGYTALMHAVDVDTTSCSDAREKHHDQIRIINWILTLSEDKADAEKQTKTGITALMLAVVRDNMNALSCMLENRPNLNLQDMHGTTALMIAVHEKNLPMVGKLLDFGADTQVKDSSGKTAIDYAANDPEMLARFFPSRHISPALQRLRAPIYIFSGANNEPENINVLTSAQAVLELGIMYKMGQGVPRNYALACRIFNFVRQQEDKRARAHASYELGEMFLEGLGVQKDLKEALYYFCDAVYAAYPQIWALGCARAAEILDQEGPLHSKSRARHYFELAASQDDNLLERAKAAIKLGDIYYLGVEVTQDYEKAREYFELAADQKEDEGLQKIAKEKIHEIDAILARKAQERANQVI